MLRIRIWKSGFDSMNKKKRKKFCFTYILGRDEARDVAHHEGFPETQPESQCRIDPRVRACYYHELRKKQEAQGLLPLTRTEAKAKWRQRPRKGIHFGINSQFILRARQVDISSKQKKLFQSGMSSSCQAYVGSLESIYLVHQCV